MRNPDFQWFLEVFASPETAAGPGVLGWRGGCFFPTPSQSPAPRGAVPGVGETPKAELLTLEVKLAKCGGIVPPGSCRPLSHLLWASL